MPSHIIREQTTAYDIRQGDWLAFEPLSKSYYVLNVNYQPYGGGIEIEIQTDKKVTPRATLKFKHPTTVWKDIIG